MLKVHIDPSLMVVARDWERINRKQKKKFPNLRRGQLQPPFLSTNPR
jgi:hypothetical protein